MDGSGSIIWFASLISIKSLSIQDHNQNCRISAFFTSSLPLQIGVFTIFMEQLGQMLSLDQDSIQIRISQPNQKFNFFWIGNGSIGSVFLPRFMNDVILSIGRWHFGSAPDEFPVQAQRPCSRSCWRGHFRVGIATCGMKCDCDCDCLVGNELTVMEQWLFVKESKGTKS